MKIFNVNPPARVKKSAFDLSHERKLTMEMGKLTPVFLQEVIPGDKWNIQTQSMIRFAPLLAPLYHRVNAYIHYFFVPMRLLWDEWEDFITNNTTSSLPTVGFPNELVVGKLADHLGLPPGTYNNSQDRINILPFRAYCQVWNDYYRNQHLQDEIDHKSLTDQLPVMDLLTRNWEKDYFTSCLPTAQQGDPVTVQGVVAYLDSGRLRDEEGNSVGVGTNVQAGTDHSTYNDLKESGSGKLINIENIDEVTVNVEDIRQGARLQRWLERNMRSGNRYVESLLAHFGVVSPDYRLQRAEYIGGGKTPIVISEVLNSNGDNLPQGYPTGHGISVGETNKAFMVAREHGYILGIMSIIPEPNYSQGIPKLFDRTTPTDFYFPEFAQLGEQEVKVREIYFEPSSSNNDDVFGYQSRYAEYKFIPSTIHGNFRSNLHFWHLSREFANPPSLNETFIQCVPRSEDIFAVSYDKEHLWVQLYHKVVAVRPMPYFNEPRL